MSGDSGGRIKHYARMRKGFPSIWWVIGAVIIVVGGNLAITLIWGYNHLAWGVALLLAALLAVALEGSWQIETANWSALMTERKAHLKTKAALEAERETPVSPGHRDKLKHLVRKMEEQISGAQPCRYFDHADPRADVRGMLFGHFPDQVRLLDTWNEAVAERDAAGADVLRRVRKLVSENMSSAPWNPQAILDAFQERLFISDRSPGRATPRFKANLKVEDGKLVWRIPRWEPPDLHLISPFEVSSSEGDECRKVFEAALTDILDSPEFDLLEMAWPVVSEVRLSALDALRRIEQSDEIYRRCSECRHP